MLHSVFRTIGAIFDIALWRIILITAMLNIVVWTVFVVVIWQIMDLTVWQRVHWLETLVDTFSIGAAMVIAWFLFPLTFPVVASFFDGQIVRHIEKRYYPESANLPRPQTAMVKELSHEGLFLLKVLGINIILLPIYFIPLINFFVYSAVNGYLLGREFFGMVTSHYHTPAERNALYKKHRTTIIWGGVLLLMVAAVPLVNLCVPVLAVVFMMHLYHRLR